MLRRIVVLALLALTPTLLPAQSGVEPCSGRPNGDACEKTSDIFQLLAPQLGALVAGGNPTPGQIGPIGGFGHFSLGLRASAIRADLPDVRNLVVQHGTAVRSTIPTRSQLVALPAVDASIGIFRGFPLGTTYVGGLDLLLSGSWLPDVSSDGIRVTIPGSNYRLGLGARLGLLGETLKFPGVALLVSRHRLPTADIRAITDRSDTLSVSGAGVRTDSWRLIAGKSFRPLAFAAGVGQDSYESSASVAAALYVEGGSRIQLEPLPLEQRVSRTNAFVNVALNAQPMRLVGEIGRSWGGELNTFNEFGGVRAAAPRTYGSIGLRIGF